MLIADGVAKLADFGEATEFGSPDARVTYCGTRWYRAPEQFVRDAEPPSAPPAAPGAADVWAAGCVMAECFLGHALFRGASSPDMLDKIAETLGRGGDEDLPEEYERAWISRSDRGVAPRGPGRLDALLAGTGASPAALSLLRHMLRADPSRRVSAAKALRHPFLARADPRDRVELPDGGGARAAAAGASTGASTGASGASGSGAGRFANGGGGGGVVLGAKAAARAEALRREREAAADSSDDEFDFDAAPSTGARASVAPPRRGPAAADVAAAAPAAVDGRSEEGGIPDEPTAEAEAAMAEIRRRMEAVGAGGGAGAGPGLGARAGPGPAASASIGASASATATAPGRVDGVSAGVRAMGIGGMGERGPAASSGTAAAADSSEDDADDVGPGAGRAARRRRRGGARSGRARWGWVARGDEYSAGEGLGWRRTGTRGTRTTSSRRSEREGDGPRIAERKKRPSGERRDVYDGYRSAVP